MTSHFRLLASALVASCLAAGTAGAETVDITLVLVNDADRMSAGDDGRGGYAKIAAVVAAERAARDNVLFVHAGDALSPSLLSGIDQGAHIVTLLNMVEPDIFAPGNHEFDFGPEVFRTRIGEAAFPILAANLRDGAGAELAGVEDTRTVTFGDLDVGFVGLTAEDAAVKSSPGDLVIAATVETGVRKAEELRAAGADIVVAVAHAARPLDRELFDSGAFDVILSGDDHDLMVLYDGRTAMMESSSQGDFVSMIDLTVDIEGEGEEREVDWRPNFRLVDTAGVEPETAVAAKVAEFEEQLSEELDVALGTTASELDSRRATVRGGEAALGNLIADAARAEVDADVAIINGGGIRANRLYPAGTEITRRDVLSELPFGNRIVALEVSGAVIEAALENGVSQVADGAGRFPQVSGMTLSVDLSRPAGERVGAIEIGGEPLDPTKTYTLATVDFLARGGDGYSVLSDQKRIIGERDGALLASVVMAAIRAAGTIDAKPEGRIVISR